jgi:hypothetical protein
MGSQPRRTAQWTSVDAPKPVLVVLNRWFDVAVSPERAAKIKKKVRNEIR